MSIVSNFRTSWQKIIQHLEQAFWRLSLGRANSGLVEEIHVHVTSRGMDQKLNQVANIVISDSQTIKIEPRDKTVLKDIDKAIYDANLGFAPQNQWDYLLIKVPPLTTDRRRDLTKIVSRDGEDAKIAIRNKRHDARKQTELQFKAEEMSENTKKSIENEVDDIAKEFNDKIDEIVKNKAEDVMKV